MTRNIKCLGTMHWLLMMKVNANAILFLLREHPRAKCRNYMPIYYNKDAMEIMENDNGKRTLTIKNKVLASVLLCA